MPSQIVPDARVEQIGDADARDRDYVLYWMQQSQRAESNHALEFAVQRANARSKRLLVCFGVTDQYPDANVRHFRFMLEGLQETAEQLRRRNIPFVLRKGDPADVTLTLGERADEIVCDRGYLRHQCEWRSKVAASSTCRVFQVESDLIVPVEHGSEKREYAARTIRKKLQSAAEDFLEELRTTPLEKNSLNLGIEGEEFDDLDAFLATLAIDRDVKPVDAYHGGTKNAKAHLRDFIENDLGCYEDQRLQIDKRRVSQLSPYLHFGQISPVTIALSIKNAGSDQDANVAAFIEELLVRRELAYNFVHYTRDYDSYSCLPDWAIETLDEHRDDKRAHHYTATELEDAQTHDDAWNAAMSEMKERGYLHNYLRMYWGKKILQWTNTPEHAYRTALQLNNKYFLDGRDPNSYANIAWLFGLHDRPHPEREIFGKVRYLSRGGLKRKFDIDAYVEEMLQPQS